MPVLGLVQIQIHTAWQPGTDSVLTTVKPCPWALNTLKSREGSQAEIERRS